MITNDMPASRRENLTEADRLLLARHVTDTVGHIYCIRDLPPEVTAVLFAYVSRNPLSFRENLAQLLRSGELEGLRAAGTEPVAAPDDEALQQASERARQFHEKWVVGYGHASVAEHADLKFALDDISIHAAKFLENNRLGAYTEKSSRYQIFERDTFHVPSELDEPGHEALRGEYLGVCRGLFDAYMNSIGPLTELMAQRYPRGEGRSERAWQASLKAKVCDVARYLLPASALTSVGISWNARAAEHAICKCLSSPVAEFRAIGEAMLREGRRICPALLKHARPKPYFADTPAALQRAVAAALSATGTPRSIIADFPPRVVTTLHDSEAETRLVAAILFEYGESNHAACMEAARRMSPAEQDALLDEVFSRREKFDWPLRPLEHVNFQMEIELDYGAFRDVQRHRMATLTEQATTTVHGYDLPAEFAEANCEESARQAMDAADRLHRRLFDVLPAIAPYVVAQGFRKRVLFSWNLRELEHFIRLRSGRQGHTSYRRVAQLAHRELQRLHPRLARHLACDHDDYGLGRLDAEERTEARRAAAARHPG